MTTKRQQIMQSVATGSYTIDDMMTLGMQRKNLVDNLKSCVNNSLLSREKDDVTGQPGYKLTPEGRHWLETGETPKAAKNSQPAVDKNTGSALPVPSVAGSDLRTDHLAGESTVAQPKPDRKPVEACADVIKDAQRNADLEVRLDSAGRTIVDFCEWLAKKAKVRCPMNLHECKAVITGMDNGIEMIGNLEAELKRLHAEAKDLLKKNDALKDKVADLETENRQIKGESQYILSMTRAALHLPDDAIGIVPAIDAIANENQLLKMRIAVLESNAVAA